MNQVYNAAILIEALHETQSEKQAICLESGCSMEEIEKAYNLIIIDIVDHLKNEPQLTSFSGITKKK